MKYRVLGPVAAIGDDGEPAALGGPKQRAVLALLLMHLGRVVRTDELIDGVWGETATKGSRRSLQTYVSELRGLLAEPIVHEGAGYRLDASRESLDAARFEDMVTAARKSLSEDAAAAAAGLRDALGLWRGSPYADVDGLPALRPEISHLEQLRLGALEDRIAADLALGRHLEVAEELDALVRQHPFRERLWAMRMLAEYRSGRQAHALDTFDRAQTLLRDELGLDPGPELSELQERILRQDPSLDVPAPDAATDAADTDTPAARGLEVRDLVGEGRHAKVFRAFQASMGREVALKVVSGEVANDRGFVHRFHDVARRWALLDHPHVLSLLDAWRDPDGANLVFPFLEDDVPRRLADGPMPAPAALRVIDETAQAVAYLHRHGMAHGSLRASNVLLDDEGHVRLADAGMAAMLGEAHREEDLSGLADLAADLLTEVNGRTGEDVRDVLAAARAGEHERAEDFQRDLRRAVGADVVAMAMAVPSSSDAVRNPFKGLRPFQEADADDFFGREGLVDAVVDQLERQPFVAVVGPSGTGKSSLVRAGVLPAVRSGAASGAGNWLVTDLFPGQYPFEELLTALRSVAVQDVDVTAGDLARDERALLRAVKQALPSDDDVLLLFIDQLEEVFSPNVDADESEVFLAALATAAREAGDRLRVLVTLRGDFFEHGLRHPTFAPLLTRTTVPVGMPSSAELAAAIARPAHEAGLELEPGLVDEIVADIRKQPGGLPMLQYACTELVERRDGDMLTRAAYRASGGVAGALERRAEEVFRSLSIASAGAAEAVFLRLVSVRTDGQDVRRRVHRTELDALHGDTAPVDAVITAFGAARLLTFDRDPVTRGPTVEIAHDALLTHWSRLHGWLDARRDDIVQRQRLHDSVREWEDAGRDRGFLLSEARLVQYEGWASSAVLPLTAREREYLEASRDAADRRRERQERLERRSVNRMRAVAVVSVVAALVAAGLSWFAFGQSDRADQQRLRAERQERIATARELAATAVAQLDEDPELSILLAVEAVETTRRTGDTTLPEAETALRRAIQSSRVVRSFPSGSAQAVAADGRIATLGTGGTLTIWDPESTEPVLELGGQVAARDLRESRIAASGDVDFSPDGSTIVAADVGHRGKIRDATTGEVVTTLEGELARPQFSPDGRRIAALLAQPPAAGSGAGRDLGVWDVATGRLLHRLEGHSINVEGHAFSPDGTLLATAARAEGVWLWEVASGETRWRRDVDSEAYSVAFHPDGGRVAAGTAEGRTVVRDVTSGEVTQTLTGRGGFVRSVAFSPDGERLLAANGVGSTRMWNVATGQETVMLRGPGLVEEVAFAPDGQHAVTTTQEDTTHVWNVGVGGGSEYAALPSYSAPVPVQAEFAPTGRRLAVSAPDGHVGIWDLDSLDETLTLDNPRPAHLVDWSGDGEVVATATVPGLDDRPPEDWADEIDLWDATSGEHLTRLTGFSSAGWDLALNTDGSTLAHAGHDGVLRLVDTSSGSELHRYVHEQGPIYRVAFTPDAERLVVGAQDAGFVLDAADGQVVSEFDVERSLTDVTILGEQRVLGVELASRLVERDLETGEAVRTIAREPGIVTASRAEDLVAYASSNMVTVRDVETGEVRFRVEHDFELGPVRFSPDGRYLVAWGNAGRVEVHVVEVDDLLDLADERVTRTLTSEECEQYLHGPCPAGNQ